MHRWERSISYGRDGYFASGGLAVGTNIIKNISHCGLASAISVLAGALCRFPLPSRGSSRPNYEKAIGPGMYLHSIRPPIQNNPGLVNLRVLAWVIEALAQITLPMDRHS